MAENGVLSAVHLGAKWSSCRESAKSHAARMGRLALPAFAQLMNAVADQFYNLPAPSTKDELSLREEQSRWLTKIVSTISHGGVMARIRPEASEEILVETRKVIDRSFPASKRDFEFLKEQMEAFLVTVRAICHAHAMRRISS